MFAESEWLIRISVPMKDWNVAGADANDLILG